MVLWARVECYGQVYDTSGFFCADLVLFISGVPCLLLTLSVSVLMQEEVVYRFWCRYYTLKLESKLFLWAREVRCINGYRICLTLWRIVPFGRTEVVRKIPFVVIRLLLYWNAFAPDHRYDHRESTAKGQNQGLINARLEYLSITFSSNPLYCRMWRAQDSGKCGLALRRTLETYYFANKRMLSLHAGLALCFDHRIRDDQTRCVPEEPR